MAYSEEQFLEGLEVELAAELALAHSDDPEAAFAVPQDEWLFDPADLEREEVGLRNLLGAVEALERRPEAGTDWRDGRSAE
jgi:hypothetical protein